MSIATHPMRACCIVGPGANCIVPTSSTYMFPNQYSHRDLCLQKGLTSDLEGREGNVNGEKVEENVLERIYGIFSRMSITFSITFFPKIAYS
jgi:hypothetical protein